MTFSTTWYSPSSIWAGKDYTRCSPAWEYAHLLDPGVLTECGAVRPLAAEGQYLEMMRNADFWSYTVYPPTYPPNTPGKDSAFFQSELAANFADMRTVSESAGSGGYTHPFGPAGAPEPIVIQEIGYPSSYTTFTDDAISDQQAAFVDGAFAALGAYNSNNGRGNPNSTTGRTSGRPTRKTAPSRRLGS